MKPIVVLSIFCLTPVWADMVSPLYARGYRELQLPFGEWVEQVRAAGNRYAQSHGLPVRNERFDWGDLSPAYRGAQAPME